MSISKHTSKLKGSASLKAMTIFILIIILMIPNYKIKSLINERSSRKATVEREVAKSYGLAQQVTSPIIRLPYTYTYTVDYEERTKKGFLNFSPKSTIIDGEIMTDTRKRSIFDILVYDAALDIEQTFDMTDINMAEYDYDINYDEAYFIYGVSDPNGISSELSITVNGQALKNEGLVSNNSGNRSYIKSSPFTLDMTKTLEVKTKSTFKGTSSIQFEPIGHNYTVSLESPWPHPSFIGSKLPNRYDITHEGFDSHWALNKFANAIPKAWMNHDYNIHKASFGVNFIQPLDEYGKTKRTAKYALLIIILCFSIYFIFEILQKKPMHPIQYILVGSAITVFFLLLISLSEHIGYNLAYLISSIATIGLISFYSSFILSSLMSTIVLSSLLSGLFTYIYLILQMQDFALLAGALALFVIIGSVMMISRNVNWYALKTVPIT